MDATNLAAAITLTYNAQGWRTALTDATGTTQFSHDALGRITGVTAPTTGSVGYGYNARGQRTALTYPDSTVIAYAYWADGQLQTVREGATTLADYTYDNAGRLAEVTRANGATTAYAYDNADRLRDRHTTVGGSTVSRFAYTVDRQGLRTDVTETLTATRSIAYRYDGLNRLTGADESGSTTNSYAYGYDLAGNRTSVTVHGTTTAYTYNAANQVTNAGYSYDAAGNLLSDGTTSHVYDALNRVTSSGGISAAYNGDGVLVQRGATHYTQDLAAPLSQILNDGTANAVYGHERLFTQQGATRTWYTSDALGSVRATLDGAGTVQGTVGYDPWGTPQGDLLGAFGFTGELQDGTSGLVHLRARWYAPGQSTFTSRDPFAGFPETPYSLHPYQYGYSNPALWTDPTGECTFIGVDTAVCAFGAIVIVLAVAGGVIAVTPQSQEALDDATNAFMDLLRPITAWEDARRAARMIEHLGWLTKPGGFALDPQLGAMRALIVVLDSWTCLERLPGFDLEMPDITDVLRLGPALERVLDPLTTPFPRGAEQGPVVMTLQRDLLPDVVRYPLRDHLAPQPGRRGTAIARAWREEAQLVRQTGRGSQDWTPSEIQELLQRGEINGYTGHHINNVDDYPDWAGDPRNIIFLANGKTGGPNEHLQALQGHRGHWSNPTSGRLIDRQETLQNRAK